MKRSFVAEVLKLMPEFSLVDRFFCERPIGHFLRGFLFEKRPENIYVWKFIVPIFDRVEFIHLSYGSVLTSDLKVESGQSLAAAFVKCVDPYRSEISSLNDLNSFLKYIEDIDGIRNTWIWRGYAMTLIMLGRSDDAMRHLKLLATTDAKMMPITFQRDISIILDNLASGIGIAQETLLLWEAETKARFQLAD